MPGFGRAERRNMLKKIYDEAFKEKTIKMMIKEQLSLKEIADKEQ